MIDAPVAVRDLINSNRYATHWRLLIEDPDGTFRDYSDQQGLDWRKNAEWGKTVDQTRADGSVVVFREADGVSLSPLVGGSPLNRNAANEYAKAIDVGRRLQIWTQDTAVGVAPVEADWILEHDAIVQKIAKDGADGLKLSTVDRAILLDKTIRVANTYGSAVGTPVIEVMQAIIDDNLGAGVFTLVADGDPQYGVVEFTPFEVTIWEALEKLSSEFAGYLDYRQDTLYVVTPDRTTPSAATSQATIGPEHYKALPKLDVDRDDIRNVIQIRYPDENGAIRTVTATHPLSVADYDEQFMGITLDDSTAIDTDPEAQRMADDILSDTALPRFQQQIVNWYWALVELGDHITWKANGRDYDSDQIWAVTGYRHRIEQQKRETVFDVRGAATAGYKRWIRKGSGEPERAYAIQYASDATGADLSGTFDPNVHLYARHSTNGGESWTGWYRIVGETGAGGPYTDYIFRVSATQPATPEGDAPAGWSDSPPPVDPDAGERLWMSNADRAADGTLLTTWAVPVRMTGEAGPPGKAPTAHATILSMMPGYARIRFDGSDGSVEGQTAGVEYQYRLDRIDETSLETIEGGWTPWVAGNPVTVNITRGVYHDSIINLRFRDVDEAESEIATIAIPKRRERQDPTRRLREALERSGMPGLPGEQTSGFPTISDDGIDILVNPGTRRVENELMFPGGMGMGTGEDYAGRAGTGLNGSGVVQVDVPRLRAVADVPAISTGQGRLLPTEPVEGGTLYPVDTGDAVSVLTNGATVESGAGKANAGLGTTGLVELNVPRDHAAGNLPAISTGQGRLVPTEPIEGGTLYPVDTGDNVAVLANGATVEGYANRAGTGLDTGGAVQVNVPRSRAAANLPAISSGAGRLVPTEPVEGGTLYPVDTGDSVAILTNGATVESEAAAGQSARTQINTELPAGDTLEGGRRAQEKAWRGAGLGARHLVESHRDREGQPGLPGVRHSAQELVSADGIDTLLDPSTRRVQNALLFPGGVAANTVETGAGRANTGLAADGKVGLSVPRTYAAADLPSISTGAGRLVPTEPVEGGTAYPVDTADSVAALTNGATVEDGATRARDAITVNGELQQSVTQSDGVQQRVIAKGHQEGSGLLDGGGVTFNPVFQNPPMILLRGGITYNASISGDQALDRVPLNVSSSGFTLRAKNIKRGAVTQHTDNFAAGVLNGSSSLGAAINCNLDPAGASGSQYTVTYNLLADTDDTTLDLTFAIDTNDGSGWVERVTSRHLVAPMSSGWTENVVRNIIVSGLGLNDDIRVRFKADNSRYGTGVTTWSVDPTTVVYSLSTDTEEPATLVNAYEVSYEAMAVN